MNLITLYSTIGEFKSKFIFSIFFRKRLLIPFFQIVCFGVYGQIVAINSSSNFQSLINANPVGTTYLVEPGNYGLLNINKKIYIIGTGFNLDNGSVYFNQINFNNSSQGSILSSVHTNVINIGVDNITVMRSKISGILRIGADSTSNGNQLISAKNVKIKQCFISDLNGSVHNNQIDNFIIHNNIFEGNIESIYSQGLVYNNTFGVKHIQCGSQGAVSSLMYNNIIIPEKEYDSSPICGGNKSTTTSFYHNLVMVDDFNTNDTSNLEVSNFSSVFVGYPTNNGSGVDGRWKLSQNSPAKNAGVNGEDCGAFGGSEPYIENGLPAGPIITEVIAPAGAAAGQTITIQVKAKTQN